MTSSGPEKVGLAGILFFFCCYCGEGEGRKGCFGWIVADIEIRGSENMCLIGVRRVDGRQSWEDRQTIWLVWLLAMDKYSCFQVLGTEQ